MHWPQASSTSAPAASSLPLMSSASALSTTFLDLAAGLDEVLGFLQAQTGDRAHFLDHVDLLCAGVLENDVEFGLFFFGRGASAPSAGPAIMTAPPAAGSMPYSSLRMVFSSWASRRVRPDDLFCEFLQISHFFRFRM